MVFLLLFFFYVLDCTVKLVQNIDGVLAQLGVIKISSFQTVLKRTEKKNEEAVTQRVPQQRQADKETDRQTDSQRQTGRQACRANETDRDKQT